MAGHWAGVQPTREGVYWALAPDGLEPELVAIQGEHCAYLERRWELASPKLFWTEPLEVPSPPDGVRSVSTDQAVWTPFWPEIDGVYWLYHPGIPTALAQVTQSFRGYIGTEDAWERDISIPGELFWSEPILPPALPKTMVS